MSTSIQPNNQACDNVRLAPGVRLRCEHFGGIVFDTRTGLTLDVDREAFAWLRAVREHRINSADAVENRLFARLLDLGIVTVVPSTDVLPATVLAMPVPTLWPSGPQLTAPETVHWAITYQCAARCPDCYARRCREGAGEELDTAGALRLVDRLAEWGVLQVAIGGGEPLLRPDLADIAAHARERGLVVHVTTGYHRLDYPELAPLARGVTTLQIGIKADRLLQEAAAEIDLLAESVEHARAVGLLVGANLMLSRSVLERFDQLLLALRQAGFPRLTFLRYKPPADVARWRQEAPDADAIRAFERNLPAVLATVPEMTVRLDCALSFLQRHVPPDAALAAGVRGCVVSDRILALAPDGAMYPCSQLVHPRFWVGNILADDLAEVWEHSRVLKRYRHCRTQRTHRESWCGICRAKSQCGGCRVFAPDGLGGEPACPEPIPPPLTALGKQGRRVDFAAYLAESSGISVATYMQRYGVGQKTAVRELRASSLVVPPPRPATGREPADYYMSVHENLITSVQRGIGFTAAGFPYATREEIRKWTAETDCDGYPTWLLPAPTLATDYGEGVEDEDYQYPEGIHRGS
ncbi:MAG: radical SAM protein [Armatimonadota bacterium]